jgi:hypothetical protein
MVGRDRNDGESRRTAGRANEQGEEEAIARHEPQEPEVGGRPRGAGADQNPHYQAEVVSGNLNQVALGDVLPSSKPGATHATAIENVRERLLA